MPNAVRSPAQIRVTIAVSSIEQISGSTVVRASGNTETGILAGQRITLSGCSVTSYNTTHTVTATASDGTGPYLVLGNTTFDGIDSQGTIEGQLEPITVLHGKSSNAGVQITKRSDGSHQLVLLEGGQGGSGSGGGGANTLDQAYDQGGAGAGRSVDVNSGAITFTNAAGPNSILQLEQGQQGQIGLHVIHTSGGVGTNHGTAITIDATMRDLPSSIFELNAGQGATTNPVFTITGREVIVNEAGTSDISFRAEADNAIGSVIAEPDYLFFADSVTGYLGAGTSVPLYNFHAKGGTSHGAAALLETSVNARNSRLILGHSGGTSGTFDLATSTYGSITYEYDDATTNKPGFMAFDRFGSIVFNSGQGRAGQNIRPDFKIHPNPIAGGVAIGFDSELMAQFGGDCLAIGQHPSSALSDMSLAVGRECSANGFAVAIGEDCNSAGHSIALGISADTTAYNTDPVIAMNNGSSAGSGGGSTANTVVIDSGNQAPSAAVSIGGSGGNGNIYVEAGGFFSGAADYAEMFEWLDGNGKAGSKTDINLGGPGPVDRRGLFVTLAPRSDKIQVGMSKLAAPGGFQVLGVTTGRPAIVGDAATLSWTNKFELDDFGAVKTVISNGKKQNKVNPNFNPSKQYLPRSQRTEWTAVGLLGKLFVRCSDSSVQAGDWVRPDILTGMAIASGSKRPYEDHRQGLGFHYQILRVMRPATKAQYGIVEILLVR